MGLAFKKVFSYLNGVYRWCDFADWICTITNYLVKKYEQYKLNFFKLVKNAIVIYGEYIYKKNTFKYV